MTERAASLRAAAQSRMHAGGMRHGGSHKEREGRTRLDSMPCSHLATGEPLHGAVHLRKGAACNMGHGNTGACAAGGLRR